MAKRLTPAQEDMLAHVLRLGGDVGLDRRWWRERTALALEERGLVRVLPPKDGPGPLRMKDLGDFRVVALPSEGT